MNTPEEEKLVSRESSSRSSTVVSEGAVLLTESLPEGNRVAATSLSKSSKSSVSDNTLIPIGEEFEPQVKKVCGVPVRSFIILAAATLCVLSGVFQTLASKFQNMQSVPKCDGCEPELYMAPFWQTMQMFIGEHLCIYIYLIRRCLKDHLGPFKVPHSEKSLAKPKCNPLLWAGGACLDLAGSGAINYASTITLASTVQVLRNFLTLITAFLTLFILKNPMRTYQWTGVMVLTAGMILTAMYDVLHPQTNTTWDPSLSWLGIVLAIVSTCIQSFQMIYEETLMKNYKVSPTEAVGWEGTTGLVLNGILLVILQFTGGEDVKGTMYQTGHSGALMGSTLFYLVMVIGFNSFGIMITLMVSGLMRTFLFALRSVIVWAFELIFGWNTFNGLNLAGQLVCLVGISVFVGAIVFPCWPSVNRYWKMEIDCPCLNLKFQDKPNKEVSRSSISSASDIASNQK